MCYYLTHCKDSGQLSSKLKGKTAMVTEPSDSAVLLNLEKEAGCSPAASDTGSLMDLHEDEENGFNSEVGVFISRCSL